MKSTHLRPLVKPIAFALALTAGIISPSTVRAAGLIMVDPGFAPIHARSVGRIAAVPGGMTGIPSIMIGRPVPPGHGNPGPTPIPPTSTTPILRGGISFGLRLQSQDIKVEICDQVARTYIEQTFINDGDQNLAGTYLFPLPVDTAFSSFSLHIDGKPVEGKILEANEARAQYEEIVRKMIDPGLLEYADYKTVRARIFPIPAHGTKKVQLEYTQLLRADNGLVKYRFPLKGDTVAQGDIEETKISVKLAGKQGLRTIWSPSHTIDLKREDNNRAKVAFLGHGTNGTDRDFTLYYSVSDKEMQANLLTNKIEAEDGYFLLSLAPPLKNSQVQPKDIVLVADTSGSMQGEKLEQTKKALKYVVNALSAGDRFGLVQFNTDADVFKSSLVAASVENKKAADSYIDDLEARGGTNISGALNSGVSLLSSADTRPAYLVLLTDGEPTVGETSLTGLLKTVNSKRDLRLFDFGVGYDVNTRLLTRLAEDHHGTSQFLEPNENLENALASFYNKIKSPVLADCQITYDGITTKDVYPRAVKDIFAGSQVLLLGRYKGSGKAKVTVSGKVNGLKKDYIFPVDFSDRGASHGYLPRLWAMRRIGHLTDVAQENGDNREVVDEIVSLSKKYGIITAYTSFLVTDPSEDRRIARGGFSGNRPIPVAVPMSASMPAPFVHNGTVTRSSVRGTFNSLQSSPLPGFGNANQGLDNLALSVESAAAPAASPGSGGAGQQGLSRWAMKPNVWDARDKSKAAFNSAAKSVQITDSSAVTGQAAVQNARLVAMLKDSREVPGQRDGLKKEMKQTEGKTFYLGADGVTWTDSQYKNEPAEKIVFASARYFELAKRSAKLASYLAVGQQVVFLFEGHAYKVVAQQ